MTFAFAAVAGLLAALLVVALVRSARAKRLQAGQLTEAARKIEALASELASTREALTLLDSQLTAGRSLIETAERLRLQREWAELAGPEVALPAAWDASLGCVVVSELEIIREVVGTPSTVETIGGDCPATEFRLALAAEFLRAAARDADEMHVTVGDRLVVRCTSVASGAPISTPHLDSIKTLIARGGADVLVDPADGGFTATLAFRD